MRRVLARRVEATRNVACGVPPAPAVSRPMAAVLVMAILAAVVAGCMPLGPQAGPEGTPVDPNPPEKSVTVVLHFPDKTGRWLEMESRPVSGNQSPEVIALAEWVSGPKSPTLGQFLPAGMTAELVEVKDGTAFVSLSPQIRNVDPKHAALVLQALVNTMTEVSGISRVQVLVDGKKEESLARNYAAEPLKRDMNPVARQGYRPIPDWDVEAGEMLVTGLVTDVDASSLIISLSRLRVPPEVYSGSGRRVLRFEGTGAPTTGVPATGATPLRPAIMLSEPPILPPSRQQPRIVTLGDTRPPAPDQGVILKLKMPLKVAADAIVHKEDESLAQCEIALSDVKAGDVVRMILNRDQSVRAIVVCYQAGRAE
ncbi:MAG: GerMN domain-containing protein [Firmicutes bacterium]|nr:GerMN domain-containing protein [Bacillota bacterium]